MKSVISLFLLAVFSVEASCEVKPVMLFLSGKDQPDTLGYNLVAELPALLYESIVDGGIPLWDGPEKQIRIQPSSLRGIEESNGLSFSASPQLFILEKWKLEKNNLKFELSGFYFSDRTAKGEEISYGFVDYQDAELLLTANAISANANGSCFSTFKYVILNHLYFYNIVQFGTKKISNLDESQKLKNQYASMITVNTPPPPTSKKIIYLVEKPDAESVSITTGTITYQMLRMIEDYMNNNKEVYLNLGGDKLSDFRRVDFIKVRSFEAEEIWTRNDSAIDSQVLTLTIHMENGTLNPLTAEDLWKLDISSGDSKLANLLKQKEFYFRILRINADPVPPGESQKYLKALKKYSWNQVKEYVKYD